MPLLLTRPYDAARALEKERERAEQLPWPTAVLVIAAMSAMFWAMLLLALRAFGVL